MNNSPLLTPIRARWEHLCVSVGVPHFLRRHDSDDFLFVTNLPQLISPKEWNGLSQTFAREGFCCHLHPDHKLASIDLVLEQYALLEKGLPLALPSLPVEEALRPAYALCRLLLLHPAPLEAQPLAPLRCLLKREEQGLASALLEAITPLHQTCAALLRQHQPLPHTAGQPLCAWLAAQTDFSGGLS